MLRTVLNFAVLPLPSPPPAQPAQAVAAWGIDYVVLTSVDRDDLPDGGAAHIAATIAHLKQHTDGRLLVEALVPDFQVGVWGGSGGGMTRNTMVSFILLPAAAACMFAGLMGALRPGCREISSAWGWWRGAASTCLRTT